MQNDFEFISVSERKIRRNSLKLLDVSLRENLLSTSSSQGCSHNDPKSGGEGEILNPGLSGSLHWTEGTFLILSEPNTRNVSTGWSKTERLQWDELHPYICWEEREIWRSGRTGEILMNMKSEFTEIPFTGWCNGADWQKGSDVNIGNRDGLCRIKACERVCFQQSKHNWHLRMRRIIQYVIEMETLHWRGQELGVHSFWREILHSSFTQSWYIVLWLAHIYTKKKSGWFQTKERARGRLWTSCWAGLPSLAHRLYCAAQNTK